VHAVTQHPAALPAPVHVLKPLSQSKSHWMTWTLLIKWPHASIRSSHVTISGCPGPGGGLRLWWGPPDTHTGKGRRPPPPHETCRGAAQRPSGCTLSGGARVSALPGD